MGLGTYGSRSLSVGGVAVAHAADKIADKVREIVAHNLEADPSERSPGRGCPKRHRGSTSRQRRSMTDVEQPR
jgi:CO/xanthine dehydrogenase Mo-binding subunit